MTPLLKLKDSVPQLEDIAEPSVESEALQAGVQRLVKDVVFHAIKY